MNTQEQVPVVILNGFLGSGKTTLFRSLLAQAKKEDIAIGGIVNDMSDLDVDGELLGNTDAVEDDNSILESIHSCVLSSEIGIKKLDQALHTLLANPRLELIIIETSGSCHPMPLISYFKEQSQVKLTGVFTLVDSLMLSHDFNYGEQLIPKLQENMKNGKRDTLNLLVEQLMFSSHIFLTKGDRIPEEKLPHIVSYIQDINPYASSHSVRFGKLDIHSLFELQEYDYFKVAQLIEELDPVLAAEAVHANPYDLATRVIHDDRPFHPKRLWDICHQHLDQKIYRSKGFFWLASRDKHSMLWNQAAGGINLEIIGTWRSGIVEDENHGLSEMEIVELKKILLKESGRFGDRHCDLTVIGDQSHVDRFTDALKSCFLNDQEIALWRSGHQFEDPWPKNIVRMMN
jgi:G3E family GTPase